MSIFDQAIVPVRVDLQRTAGFMAGMAAALPWLGRVGGVPSSAFALVLPAAVGLLVLGSPLVPRRTVTAIAVMIGCYLLTVVAAASTEQLEFLLLPFNWMADGNYYQSKLLRFFIALVPPLFSFLLIAHLKEPRSAIVAALSGIVVVAFLALCNFASHADVVFRTDYETARHYFRNPYIYGHSTVSYGILFCMAAIITSLRKKLWVLTPLFIAALFVMARRTEFLLATFGVLAVAGWWWFHSERGQAVRLLAILPVAAALAAVLANEASTMRWLYLQESALERAEILKASDTKAEDTSEARTTSSPRGVPALKPVVSDEPTFGRGLGWYSTLGGSQNYPHNVIYETLIEIGMLGTAILTVIYLYGLLTSLRYAIGAPWSLAVLMITGALAVVSMKAGDITAAARFMPFLLLLACIKPAQRRSDDQKRRR